MHIHFKDSILNTYPFQAHDFVLAHTDTHFKSRILYLHLLQAQDLVLKGTHTHFKFQDSLTRTHPSFKHRTSNSLMFKLTSKLSDSYSLKLTASQTSTHTHKPAFTLTSSSESRTHHELVRASKCENWSHELRIYSSRTYYSVILILKEAYIQSTKQIRNSRL